MPHLRLLRKVESYGIKGNLLKWIGSFFIEQKTTSKGGGTLQGDIEELALWSEKWQLPFKR